MRSSTFARHSPVQRFWSLVSCGELACACAAGASSKTRPASGSKEARQRRGGAKLRMAGLSSAPTRRFSTQPFGGFLDHAEVGIFFDIDIRVEQTDLLLQLQIALQRREIRRAVRVAILVARPEGPIHARRWRLIDAGDGGDSCLVILRIGVP